MPESIEIILDEFMTSREVGDLMNYNSLNALTQPGAGFADRHDVEKIMVAGTLGYRAVDVMMGAMREFGEERRDWHYFMNRLWTWFKQYASPRRGKLNDDWLTAQDAMTMLEITSRERIYQLGDWRGGPIHTVKFGRVRLYNHHDVQEIRNARTN